MLENLTGISLHPSIVFLGGLVIVILGADWLLRAASRLAVMLKVSPILIGLTVVTIGTTTPEMAVSLTAAHEGKANLALGNIAGTNLFNILMILGLSALIRPLPTQAHSVKMDVPAMIGAALALLLMALDGQLSRTEGALLLVGAVLYTLLLVQVSRQESAAMRREFAQEFGAEALQVRSRPFEGAWNLGLLLVGLAMTVLGAKLLVAGAVSMAKAYGVSDTFIGLTIVAMGTSAPELVTAMVATWRNERDVTVGNLVGSCIYNILVIMGLSMLTSPSTVVISKELLWFDLPLGLLVALACYPVFKSGKISRGEGLAFVLVYLVYLGSLLWLRT